METMTEGDRLRASKAISGRIALYAAKDAPVQTLLSIKPGEDPQGGGEKVSQSVFVRITTPVGQEVLVPLGEGQWLSVGRC